MWISGMEATAVRPRSSARVVDAKQRRKATCKRRVCLIPSLWPFAAFASALAFALEEGLSVEPGTRLGEALQLSVF